jgi:hypothetical protein
MSYSHMGTPTLPSALSSFTSEFGMGSGGTYSLLLSDKPVLPVSVSQSEKRSDELFAKPSPSKQLHRAKIKICGIVISRDIQIHW